MNDIYTFVPEKNFKEILSSLCAITGLPVSLVDSKGNVLMEFGGVARYCKTIQDKIFSEKYCHDMHMKAGERALNIGEAYIFSCNANLNHVAFPLISKNRLLGSIIAGPFLLDAPDSTIICGIKAKQEIAPSLCLELYEDLAAISVLEPKMINHLMTLFDFLLPSLIPDEKTILKQANDKLYQQAKINETIQNYKFQNATPNIQFLYEKEKQLLSKVKTGNVQEVKSLLNDLLGFVLFSVGGTVDVLKARAVELTTLLSRVAIENGAKADSIYDLNAKFMSLLYEEQEFDDICLELQEVAESFMNAIFFDKDIGNAHIRNALHYMTDNYFEHLELSQIAEKVHLSPNYFSALFKKTLGTTFTEQLNIIRVEKSKHLLSSTRYSIAEIAIAVGFPDQSYFCKVFKRIVGTTPGKFRS